MSDLLFSAVFDTCRNFINTNKKAGWSWDDIRTMKGQAAEQVDAWFVSQCSFSGWPSLGDSPDARRANWIAIVNAKQLAEEEMIYAARPLVVLGREEAESDIKVTVEERACWPLYKAHLLKNGMKETAVEAVEESSIKIVRRLRKQTTGRQPVRGMVVGHVQSGKTASMAGLIAMAADHGWNMFIVLTGTLENLRRQTGERLIRDLNHPGNLHWSIIDHPSADSAWGNKAQNKHFGATERSRHLIVCLKNPTRLKNLLEWMTADLGSLRQMKILIIDDEADQAGVNTAKPDAAVRSAINSMIISLTQVKALAVNYVGYTATPAANFLNEGPGSGLYPEDFIVSLTQSDEHFGPRQIFGATEYGQDPLGIVQEISRDGVRETGDLHADPSAKLPESLISSIHWFICTAAAMRAYGIHKPVSMLIHTSQKQQHHANVAAGVERFLKAGSASLAEFTAACKRTWDRLTADFTLSDFAECLPGYGRIEEIPDYPDFDDLRDHIRDLVSEISAIRLSEEGKLTYHRGTHVCIDNCANTGINEENQIRRLFYPDPNVPSKPTFATAFIVIGGSTLARGLTIENLTSTFFLRASVQADSLMQMGRWFGYRKGYELLPRIWMPKETREKFEFMTIAEEDLRTDLKRFMDAGAKPAEFGPRVRVHPRAAWLIPTAKNRMREREGAKYDFSGVNRQVTAYADGNGHAEISRANFALTSTFIESLASTRRESDCRPALVWDGVSFEVIAAFLTDFRFHQSAQFFSEIALFIRWYRENSAEAGYADWNVVVAGKDGSDSGTWALPGGGIVNKVSRTRLSSGRDESSLSIGALREPRDLLADIRGEGRVSAAPTNDDVDEARSAGGLEFVPQLLIYLIDKGSRPPESQSGTATKKRVRLPLAVDEDIVGISIWLPRAGKTEGSYVTHLTVKIPRALESEADDLPDAS